jgi:hypothetical protein
LRLLNIFRKVKAEATRNEPEKQPDQEISFTTEIGPKKITLAEVKASEFSLFLNFAVKYGDREVMAVGTGEYLEKQEKVVVTSIYPVVIGSAASVTLSSGLHTMLDRTLDKWNEKDELMIIHTHPGFSSSKSQIDDAYAIRVACLMFDGKAVMLIVDPFSSSGIEISAYAINPETKDVGKIEFRLVP